MLILTNCDKLFISQNIYEYWVFVFQNTSVYLIRMQNQESHQDDRRTVETMFDSIAHRYDLLNRLLSFGADVRWRRKLYAALGIRRGAMLLDLATGSGDILTEFLSRNSITGIGCDRSAHMLTYARRKLEKKSIPSRLVRGDAFALPFKSDTFDVVTIGFGIRNMRPRSAAVREIRRIIKPGGRLAVLEFFPKPTGVRGKLYKWYSTQIIPMVGGLISGSSEAYRYLPHSIKDFPDVPLFADEISSAGFEIDTVRPLTFGVVFIVIARKS